MSKTLTKKRQAKTNFDNVVFEQLYAEDVNHASEARRCGCVRGSNSNSVQSLLYTYHARPLFCISATMSNIVPEGRREDALVKQRNQAREEYERQKQQLINETEKARPSAHRFVGQNDSMEDSLKNSTVGLVKLEDFQQKRKELEEAKAREAARTAVLK